MLPSTLYDQIKHVANASDLYSGRTPIQISAGALTILIEDFCDFSVSPDKCQDCSSNEHFPPCPLQLFIDSCTMYATV